MNDWTSSFERGSRPVVGSSRSSRVGLVSRARAIATFCCIPRLICSTGRSSRFSEIPSRARIATASRFAVLPSRPYRRAAKRRFSIGLSFLKKAASTLTRLIRRLTAISSRTMSWPKTSTRPSSRVRSPQIRRMSVDLPGAVGAEDPVDVAALEAHRHVRDRGHRLLVPSDDEPLADVLDEEGGRTGRSDGQRPRRERREPAGSSARSSVVGPRWRSLETPGSGASGGVRKRRKPRVPIRRCSSGGPRGSGVPGCPEWAGWASKKPGARSGPRLWFVRKAVLPPAV